MRRTALSFLAGIVLGALGMAVASRSSLQSATPFFVSPSGVTEVVYVHESGLQIEHVQDSPINALFVFNSKTQRLAARVDMEISQGASAERVIYDVHGEPVCSFKYAIASGWPERVCCSLPTQSQALTGRAGNALVNRMENPIERTLDLDGDGCFDIVTGAKRIESKLLVRTEAGFVPAIKRGKQYFIVVDGVEAEAIVPFVP